MPDRFFQHHGSIGLDSNVLIALIEENAEYLPAVHSVFTSLAKHDNKAWLSVISIAEILTHPLKLNRPDIAAAYEERLFNGPLHFAPADIASARHASLLGATYGLKIRDALILSSVMAQGATGFITADKDFKSVKNLEVMLINR